MDYKTKRSGTYEAEVIMKFTVEELEEAYKAAYERMGQKMKLPGFRKGKIPLDVVEQKLGDSVLDEVARELLVFGMDEIMEEMDPQPIALPEFEVEEIKRGKGAIIKGKYESYPRFKLAKYKKIKIPEDFVKIGAATIDEELHKLRDQNATMRTREDGDVAAIDDTVTVALEIREGETEIFKNDNLPIELGKDQILPGVDEKLIGMKAGDKGDFELEISEDFERVEFAGKKLQVLAELKEARYKELPALDDEFARDMGEFETLADLKKQIQSDLDKAATDALKNKSITAILGQIVEATKIEVPPKMLESELERQVDQIARRLGLEPPDHNHNHDRNSHKGSRKRKKVENHIHLSTSEKLARIGQLSGQAPDKVREDFSKGAEKTVRERLVLRQISEDESIEPNDVDIDQEIELRYAQYLDADALARIKEDVEVRADMKSRLIATKSLDWLYDHADVKKGQETSIAKLREEGALN